MISRVKKTLKGISSFSNHEEETESTRKSPSIVDLTEEEAPHEFTYVNGRMDGVTTLPLSGHSMSPQQTRRASDGRFIDLYPDIDVTDNVPPPKPPPRTYAPRKPHRDIDEEKRLLGSFRDPKDAKRIQVPGSQDESTAHMTQKKKPGQGSAFRPRDTIASGPVQAPKRSTERPQQPPKFGQPSKATSSTSRAIHTKFGEDGQVVKRQRTGVPPRASRATATLDEDDEVVEVSRISHGLPDMRAGAAAARDQFYESKFQQSPSKWELSGHAEFNIVDKAITTNGQPQPRKPSPMVEVIPSVKVPPRRMFDNDSKRLSPPTQLQPKVKGRKLQTGQASDYFTPKDNVLGHRKSKEQEDQVKQPQGLSEMMVDGSGDELENDKLLPQPRRRSPESRKRVSPKPNEGENTLRAADSSELTNVQRQQPNSKDASRLGKPTSKTGWIVESFLDCDGKNHLEPQFFEIVPQREEHTYLYNFIGIKDKPTAPPLLSFDVKQVVSILWAELEHDCCLMRLLLAGGDIVDIRFHDREELVDFLKGLEHATTIKKLLSKPSEFLEKIYANRIGRASLQEPQEPIDAGVETRLLTKRQSGSSGIQRSITTGGQAQHRGSLLANMKAKRLKEAEEEATARAQLKASGVTANAALDRRANVIPPEVAARPVRSTRAQRPKVRSPSLDASPVRFSQTVGLGKPWSKPMVYPVEGKKRVTIQFTDLERLDDGEFLNDILIEYYFRWLQLQYPLPDDTATFFSTYFYTSITTNIPRGASINYESVARWTSKDDIFKYDYIIVPVNESSHWYLAIICNLPQVERKQVQSQDDHKGSESQPVEIDDKPAIVLQLDGSSESSPTKGIDRLRLASSPERVETARVVPSSPPLMNRPPGTNDDEGIRQKTPTQGTGMFMNIASTSPEKKNKKRKSLGPRKFDPNQPMIVILDSMGLDRNRTIANLKAYLVEEAFQKRGMTIDKSAFQGMHARRGIPQQQNWWDCGVFVCGYVHKFMENPQLFGEKLMQHEFDLAEDWPEMVPSKMRASMRTMLLEEGGRQQAAREQEARAKAERKAAKLNSSKTGVASSSPVKKASPVKPSLNSGEPNITRQTSPAKQKPAPQSVVDVLESVVDQNDPESETSKSRLAAEIRADLARSNKETAQHQSRSDDGENEDREYVVEDSQPPEERSEAKSGFTIFEDPKAAEQPEQSATEEESTQEL